MGKNEIGEY